MKKLPGDGFIVLAKLCSENATALKDDAKARYMELLQKFVKAKSPSAEGVKILLLTLKDAKKLNLNDDVKGTIVDSLFVYLKSTLLAKVSAESEDNLNVELEKKLFAALKPFKTNFQDGCVDILRKILIESSNVTSGQLQYTFKIFQVALDTKADDKSTAFIKKYAKFHEEFVSKALELKSDDKTGALIQILETNNALLKETKFQLDNTTMDEILCLSMDPRMKPAAGNIDDFCRFYSAIGEALFLIGNVRQNYFKARITQYFNIFKSFMEAIYFYKNDQPEALTTKEIILLLKLTQQLEK